MNMDSLLMQVAVDLNDAAPGHEFTTWSKNQLRAYLEEAIQIAFKERPDLFMETRIIKVQSCTILQEACDCTKIHRVIGQSTKDGRILKELKQRKGTDRMVWKGRTCKRPITEFELDEYYIDGNSDRIYVYPQVPPTLDVYIMIECAVMPENFDSNFVINSELRAAVIQWVLFRAKMVDGENSSSIVSVATQHKTTFWELLQHSIKDEFQIRDDGNANP